MRLFLFTAVLVLAGSVFGGEAQPAGAYELHEWGVFSVPRNDAWAQHDMKQEWAQMPKEFYGRAPGRYLPYRGPVKKPVIFFHAQKPLQVKLTITFAEGSPMVWWPAAEEPANWGGYGKNEPNRLVFSVFVKETPKGGANGANTIKVPEKHWMESLRAVKSEKIFCEGSFTNKMPGELWDSESFIYYDGLMKAPATPKVTREGEKIVVETPGDFVCLDLMAVERLGKSVRIAKNWSGWEGILDAAQRQTRLEMIPAQAEDFERLRKELVARLTKAGLNADEAESLAAVWNDGLFKNEGLTVFYRVPQTVYEKLLPLDAKPAPSKTVRVGLVIHERLEPELDACVAALLKQLGAEAFESREQALSELTKIGGAAFPALEKAAQGEDVEISKACRKILEVLDAKAAEDQNRGAKDPNAARGK
ncbi:MAG: hypothetical protein HY291_07515 [Planctomycetes bacterium]|nr:hypothetical protein [Planctomycetota bacterium]